MQGPARQPTCKLVDAEGPAVVGGAKGDVPALGRERLLLLLLLLALGRIGAAVLLALGMPAGTAGPGWVCA